MRSNYLRSFCGPTPLLSLGRLGRGASTVPPRAPAPPRRRHIDGEPWQPVSECDAQLRGLERRFADALDDLRQDLHTTTRAFAAEVQLDVALLRVLVALWASRKLGAKHKHERKAIEEGKEIIDSGKYKCKLAAHQTVDTHRAVLFLDSVDVDAPNAIAIAHPEDKIKIKDVLQRLLVRDHLNRVTSAGPKGPKHSVDGALDFLLGLFGDEVAPMMREIADETGSWPASEAQISRFPALARPRSGPWSR